jgi:serine/threonine-protein kinase RsbW
MSVMEKNFTLGVPSEAESMALVREFVRRVSKQAGFETNDISKITMAVDEACTNIIEHAYGYDVTKEVKLKAIIQNEALRIEIIDTGKGFDPTLVKPDAIEKLVTERRSGGLGIRLIKSLMDDVHYEISPGNKNELHLTKKLPKK